MDAFNFTTLSDFPLVQSSDAPCAGKGREALIASVLWSVQDSDKTFLLQCFSGLISSQMLKSSSSGGGDLAPPASSAPSPLDPPPDVKLEMIVQNVSIYLFISLLSILICPTIVPAQ